MPWWGWTILAGALALAEMHVPGSYLVWIALGAAVTAFGVAIGSLGTAAQLGVFAVASAVSCLAGWRVYRRGSAAMPRDAALNERGAQMVGARGLVCAALTGGQGRVRVGDSVWPADGPDLAEGTPVVVRSVSGMRLTVEAVEPR